MYLNYTVENIGICFTDQWHHKYVGIKYILYTVVFLIFFKLVLFDTINYEKIVKVFVICFLKYYL